MVSKAPMMLRLIERLGWEHKKASIHKRLQPHLQIPSHYCTTLIQHTYALYGYFFLPMRTNQGLTSKLSYALTVWKLSMQGDVWLKRRYVSVTHDSTGHFSVLDIFNCLCFYVIQRSCYTFDKKKIYRNLHIQSAFSIPGCFYFRKIWQVAWTRHELRPDHVHIPSAAA